MNLPSAGMGIDDSRDARKWRMRWAYGLVIAGCLSLVVSVPTMGFDHWLSQSIRMGDVPGDLRKAIELSEAFAHGSGVVAILLALLLASKPPRDGIWLAVATTASSGIAANLLKTAFTRARPYTYDAQAHGAQANSTEPISGWEFLGSGDFWDASQRSFPSGHTATAWGLAIGLSWVYPKASVVFFSLAILATYQRLYSGAHFPSDSVAGFGIACLFSGIVLALNQKRHVG
ncbi:MAG: phosphatase PAP2 family protein [Pirellulaceae bacterium]|nr:phosphatase PAP2 family protein [Pirellulaceae bacterium]